MSFTIATQNIKYLRVTLNKQVEDLYHKNFKYLKKKMKKTTENQKISHAFGYIVKMASLQKSI